MTSSSGSEAEVVRETKKERSVAKRRRQVVVFGESAIFLGGEQLFGFISFLFGSRKFESI